MELSDEGPVDFLSLILLLILIVLFSGEKWMTMRDEEQQNRTVFLWKTLRAAVQFSVACVGSTLTARSGDAQASTQDLTQS